MHKPLAESSPVDKRPTSFDHNIIRNYEAVLKTIDHASTSESLGSGDLIIGGKKRKRRSRVTPVREEAFRLTTKTETPLSEKSMPKKSTFKRQSTTRLLRDSREKPGNIKSPDKIANYIFNNIKHKECITYMKNDHKSKHMDVCFCGRDHLWHLDRDIQADGDLAKWTKEHCTRHILPTCFGTIRFSGFGQETSRTSPYVRVASDTPMDTIWTLLSDYWKLPQPKLIVSVTGGAKKIFMKSRLKESFKRGLVKAATSTGAWIITAGTSAGVMSFVGEAIRDYQLTTGASDQNVIALGIATWGIVDNKECLDAESYSGAFPATYNIEDLSPSHVRGISPLDHNHTHFILVDNGVEREFGSEIQFRTDLEQYISEVMETGVDKSQSVNVPVVMLVLEGGINTLLTVAEATEKHTPVVVISGSGRAADLIAWCYNHTKYLTEDDEIHKFTEVQEASFRYNTDQMMDWSNFTEKSKQIKQLECVQSIKRILNNRGLVTVFTLDDIDTTDEIDYAMLYALLKANKAEVKSQLNLALAWNRCDVARSNIFIMENRSLWQNINLEGVMFTALVQDRGDFVKLFIDNGVDLRRFLTIRRLHGLYEEVLNDHYAGTSADLLANTLEQIQFTWADYFCCRHGNNDNDNLLNSIGHVISSMVGDQFKNPYQGDKYKVKDWNRETCSTFNRVTARRSGRSQLTSLTASAASYDFDHPEKELFVWSLLFNRRNLSELFWRLGRDHISAALLACAVLKSLARQASQDEETDLANDMLQHASQYEEHATGVLNECYRRDKNLSHKLMVRELPSWTGTVFSMADLANEMGFMGHSCCQTKLNKIWKGKMALYTSTWKILSSLFLPFIIPLIKFSSEEISASKFISTKKECNNSLSQTENITFSSSSPAVPTSPPHRKRHNLRNNLRQKLRTKLYDVTWFSTCRPGQPGDSIAFPLAFYYFQTAPVVKFCYHTLSYIIFLGLYSYFVLTQLRPISQPNTPPRSEFILWIWVGSMIFEELRQILTREHCSFLHKFESYYASIWNRFDVLAHSLFVVSVISRLLLKDHHFHWTRMAYCLTLSMYYIRFMQAFFVEKNIGPKVIMVRRMLTDIMFFIAILLVFIASYSVSSQALRYPNAEISWKLLKDVLYQPYWQMYGELFLEDIEGEVGSCSTNRTLYSDPHLNVKRCAESSWLAVVLFAIYMIISNVLLLNLLVAMFSYTFERVQENSEKVWRFYRYNLIHEYFDRPTLAPPFILLTHAFRVIKYFIRKCEQRRKITNDFRQVMTSDETTKLTAFEYAGMEKYLLNKHLATKERIDSKVQLTSDRIDRVIQDLEQIKEKVITKEQTYSVPAAVSVPVSHSQVSVTVAPPTTCQQVALATPFCADAPPTSSRAADQVGRVPAVCHAHTLPALSTSGAPYGDLMRSLPAVMTREAVEALVARAEHRLVDRLTTLERRQHRIASDSSQCLRLLKRIASAPLCNTRTSSTKVNLEIDDVFETTDA